MGSAPPQVQSVGWDDVRNPNNTLRKCWGSLPHPNLRTEFINRIDESVASHPLGREQIRSISGIQIEYLRQRLLEREIGFEITDEAMDLLTEAGFDPVYGARPMKRAMALGNSGLDEFIATLT
jgi:ATP-dependent Clp protease ATP-binding subunit ClpA